MSQNVRHIHCAIIGSGPAGYTAAIYAARAELKPVMFTGIPAGGQLMITNEVENFPGYPQGVKGPDMMEDLRVQAERFGTEIHYTFVIKVDLKSTPKRFWTEDDDEYTADAIIVSTGAEAKWLGIESEKKFMNHGVSACAVCDGYFYRGKEVVVVGGGDTAAEESTYLAGLCSEVHLLVRSDKMRASKIMQKRVMETSNLKVHWNTETLEITGDKMVQGVRVKNNVTGAEELLSASGFFVAIGHKPNTDLFKGQLEMNEAGYILTQGKTTWTNIEGVFASGDCQDWTYRQAVTAAGTGCMAALDAERWLKEKGHL